MGRNDKMKPEAVQKLHDIGSLVGRKFVVDGYVYYGIAVASSPTDVTELLIIVNPEDKILLIIGRHIFNLIDVGEAEPIRSTLQFEYLKRIPGNAYDACQAIKPETLPNYELTRNGAKIVYRRI